MNFKITCYCIIAVLTSITACKNKPDDHGHEHDDPEPLTYTLYSDKTEIFVEFKPLVVGNVSKFAAHFTILGESFKPLTEGTVTVSLIVNNKGIKQQTDTPAVPGIYRLALKPTEPGTGELIFDIVTKSFTDRQIIKNVIVYPDEKLSIQNQSQNNVSTGEITYTKEQAWKTDFANWEVKKQSFHEVIKTSGILKSAPGDEQVITAISAGVAGFSGNGIVAGKAVKSGEQLFSIKGGNHASGNIDTRFKEITSNYNKAKSDYDRAKELIGDKIISQKEFDQVKREFENASANYELMSKSYSGKGLMISSPIDGFLNTISITEGQFVEAGKPIATVSKNRSLILQANLSQKYYDKLSMISTANFIVPGNEKVYDINLLKGKLIAYGKATGSNAFLPVTFEFQNPGTLQPGAVVEVYLKSSHTQPSIVIPKTALIEEQGHFYVYVQTTGESFEKREIKTGGTDGEFVQLLSGINEGDRVVTKGAYNIKLSTATGSLPGHGHEH